MTWMHFSPVIPPDEDNMQPAENKVLSLLSLAQKAGKIASGEFQTEKAVKSGLARMVILSADASGNTKKKFHNMCDWYHVPVIELAGKETLGHCFGKTERSSAAVIDDGFAAAVQKAFGTEYTRR